MTLNCDVFSKFEDSVILNHAFIALQNWKGGERGAIYTSCDINTSGAPFTKIKKKYKALNLYMTAILQGCLILRKDVFSQNNKTDMVYLITVIDQTYL
jgi:hypothetical protein